MRPFAKARTMGTTMIDSHCHIDASAFDADRTQVLERAWHAGVEAIVIPSIAPAGFDALQALVDSDECLYRGIGIHPHDTAAVTPADLERVAQGVRQTRVVAIGEIGLDYYYDFAPKDVQQEVFRAQLRIAKQCSLPVIVHNRESDADILRILTEEQDGSLRGVLHCFSSSADVLREALALGFHVSFTGNVTFKKSTLDEVVRQVPDDRFTIETDAPYITPVPHRGKRNEPSFVRFVAEKIADIRSQTTEEVLAMTTATARRFFHLMMIWMALSVGVFAQGRTQGGTDADTTDVDEDYHPYDKSFGIGPVFATNTIVEAQTANDTTTSFSYEGVFSYGGALSYMFSDRFIAQAAYVYTKNAKVIRSPNNPFGQQYPDEHHTIEIGAKYLWNPYSRVVFYLMGGGCLIQSDYDGGDGVRDDSLSQGRTEPVFGRTKTVSGVCVGLGLFAHIKTPIGLIVPGGEWRVDFFLQSEDKFLYKGPNNRILANVSTFFSLPRFTLMWYPKL
ncbi:MAG: TatD family hydrolase [Candidatus Kapaibacterium sp.]